MCLEDTPIPPSDPRYHLGTSIEFRREGPHEEVAFGFASLSQSVLSLIDLLFNVFPGVTSLLMSPFRFICRSQATSLIVSVSSIVSISP